LKPNDARIEIVRFLQIEEFVMKSKTIKTIAKIVAVASLVAAGFAFSLLNRTGPANTALTKTVHPSLLGAYDKPASRIWQQIVQYSSARRRVFAAIRLRIVPRIVFL